MIDLLRKIFIKDFQNVTNPVVREKHGILASTVGIIFNIFLFAFKLLVGLLTASMAIISDAINNLTDFLSCVVNLIGFKVASKPADKDHPFGHERIEYISGMIISLVIIAVSFILAYTSITKLITKDSNADIQTITFVILVVAIISKLILGLFYRSIGKAINSMSLIAAMQDSINDCICTGLVLVCSIIQMINPSLWWIDPTVSILMSFFIFYAGIKLVKDTADPLIGITPDSDFIKSIVKDILKFKGTLGVHDITCHSYGPTKVFVTIHVEVDGYGNIMEIHDMIDNIEHEIHKKYGCEITIHMDPIDTKNKEIPVLKELIKKTLSKIDKRITFHDLRLVAGPTHTNVLFDIVMPIESNLNSQDVTNALTSAIKESNKKYNVIINVDTAYCN